MAEPGTPSEIAREVLRRLAMQRKAPTPDNYSELYNQIAGTHTDEAFPERQFKLIAAALPRSSAEQLKAVRRFEAAIEEQNWAHFRNQLVTMLSDNSVETPNWGSLIRELITQYERPLADQTPQAKLDALSRVVESSSSDANVLFTRLQGLSRGWAHAPAGHKAAAIETRAETDTTGSHTPATAVGLQAAPETWRKLLGQTLETAIGTLLIDTPELVDEASLLSRLLNNPDECEPGQFEAQLQEFSYKVQWVVQDQGYIRQALMNLLQLIIENIAELTVDDKWMQGQMSLVLELFSRPLDKQVLEELRERLRDVIYKQGTLKRNLTEAHEKLRDMLAHFIDRLSDLSETTGHYHGKVKSFAERVGQASSLPELAGLIDEVLEETRIIEERTLKSQTELTTLRTTVDQAYREISRLENELEQASELVRHDPLTGALNRKGLDEMLKREMARQQRRNSRLCIALLDVDNFKTLNDTFGHATGDDALKHLAQVIRETLRPQDSCGRYGGEEFVILLPDTGPDDANKAITRLQRELTRRFFLHNNQKLLITFSAGVTELTLGETAEAAIDRADKAMYRAKRAGKNRVEQG